jgi:CheY-like chemotaxis protein
MKILVIDDSTMARKMLIKTLKEFISDDTQILQAKNGKEGVAQYKDEKPDLVFLDLTMPEMDGFEALKYIKLYDEDAKVVVVSADIQKASLDKVKEDGAIDFVKKPIDSHKMEMIFQKIQG